MMTNEGRRQAILAFVTAVPIACIDTQLLPNEHHCATQSGDQWCADQYPDSSRPYCSRGSCEAEGEPDPHPLDGCVASRPPDDACYSPCGDASSVLEDASCLERGSSSEGSTSVDPETPTATTGPVPQPICGDAIPDDGELCDDGELNGIPGHCALDCQGSTAGCGDGLPQPGETCDDGNAIEGDGCNPDCRASGAVVWQRQLVHNGLVRGIDIAPDGAVYVSGGISDAPSRAWAARLDDADGTIDWQHTLETPPAAALVDVFLAAHAIDDDHVVFAGRHGGQAYAVTLDEAGTFLEDAFDSDLSTTPIDEIVDIGNGLLAKRGEQAVRYNYALSESWTTSVGAGLAYRPGDDVALAASSSTASFLRFGLDGVALPPVELPVPLGLSAESRLVTWTEDGDVVVAGLVSGTDSQDAFVLRSSPAGDLRWMYGVRNLEGQERQPLCLAVDDQGAVTVGGSGLVLASPRPFLMKLSPQGERLWVRSLELTSSVGAIYGCAVNAAHEILVVGQADVHLWLAKVTP